MTTTNIAPSRANSNHVQRRGLFAGAALLAMGSAASATAPQLPVPPTSGPGFIIAVAARIKAIVDRENFLDEKRVDRTMTEP